MGLTLAALAITSTSASAHRQDELLQAARIGIGQQRIELGVSLTPGIAVADAIISEIDRDGDGELSPDEQHGYLTTVASAFHLTLDGGPLMIVPADATFPAIEALRGGDSPIELRLTAAVPGLASGAHRVSFTNAYRRDIGVYLVNALVPDDDLITIERQRRQTDQRATTIDYTLSSTWSAMVPLWIGAPTTAMWLLSRRRLCR